MPRSACVGGGTILFAMGIASHEAMITFVPTFLAMIWLSGAHKRAELLILACVALVGLTSLVMVAYTMLRFSPQDSALVCQLVLERELGPDICSGALNWMGKDLSYALERTQGRLTPLKWLAYIVGYSLSLLPFFYLSGKSDNPRAIKIIICLTALPFLGLNVVAADWGRWISFHIFSLSLMSICAVQAGRLTLKGDLSGKSLFWLCGLVLLISPTHITGLRVGGALRSLVQALI